MDKATHHKPYARLALAGQRVGRFDLRTPHARVDGAEVWQAVGAHERWQKYTLLLHKKDQKQEQQWEQRQAHWPEHPLFVQTQGVSSTLQLSYQLLERIYGSSVESLKNAACEQSNPLEPLLCASVVAQVSEAVEVLRARQPLDKQELPVGIPSPSHIFFDEGSDIKILDGAWRKTELDLHAALGASDVESAGQLLAHLLGPRTPDPSDDQAESQREALHQIVEATITKRLEDRIVDISELAWRLQQFVDENLDRESDQLRAFRAHSRPSLRALQDQTRPSSLPTRLLPTAIKARPQPLHSAGSWLRTMWRVHHQAALTVVALGGFAGAYWVGHTHGSLNAPQVIATISENIDEAWDDDTLLELDEVIDDADGDDDIESEEEELMVD